MQYVKNLDKTLSHLHSCLPNDVKYSKTKYGGIFQKGKRSIFVNIDYRKNDLSYPKITKQNGNYGVMIDKRFCCSYEALRSIVRKGLGFKD